MLVVLVLGLGVFLIKVVRRRVGSWLAGRRRDDQRVFRLTRYGLGCQTDTQLLLATILQAFGALHGANLRPATISCSDDLMHSSSGARFRGTASRVTVATRLCAVLARLLTPAIFLMVHLLHLFFLAKKPLIFATFMFSFMLRLSLIIACVAHGSYFSVLCTNDKI